ncbi:MAG: gamma-glutamyltransferase [Candidatus Heimdallarchaeota archaeon]|nr:gamma-glutamyltransferase [Candidatus Heimdallarchaeota archaeon]MCK5142624.1 gamma-glutamyltransferase [Candidatus Heimdallarchaeota archaeon]
MSLRFDSYRSPVYGRRGIVASSQPLASEAGMRILQQGGNAADAAVATAAALNVTEPCSTGIGGDCFSLYYDGKQKTVFGLNASGRAPSELNLNFLANQEITGSLPPLSVHTITVPGAAAGWVDTIEKFGTLTMKEVLAPAIELAEGGFPVAPFTALAWKRSELLIKKGPYGKEMLLNGEAPKEGEIMKNPALGQTFRTLAEHGKKGFYEGRIAKAIIDLIQSFNGVMSLDDLKKHHNTFDEPISTNYKGVDVFEIPPNGQGITALIALNILEEFDLAKMNHSSVEHLHVMIEAMRIAFADTRWYVADPDVVNVPIKELISKDYATERRRLIDLTKATVDTERGSPFTSSDTVYFSVADSKGNACSFINSNYMGFGTGLIPQGCGFTLQNRGANFTLEAGHPNVLAPNKRPYHTIIPGMATKDGELYASFGVMGGFNQPQGHAQVIINMVDYGMNPQQALNAPRFTIRDGTSGGNVALEDGISDSTMSALKSMGHEIIPTSGIARMIFGRGQIIKRDSKSGVLCGGTSPRADGLAIAW